MAKAPERKKAVARKAVGRPANPSSTATRMGPSAQASGTAMGNQIKAAKKFQAPANYKPLTTKEKLVTATSFIPGAAVGAAIGKVAAKATANRVGKAVLKASTSKKPTSIARPKAPTGKTYQAAPNKTVSVQGTTGVARVKPQGPKPTARVVARGTDLAKTDQGVRAGNALRYSNAKKAADTARKATVETSRKPAVGRVAGGTASSSATIKKTSKKK